MVRPRKLAKNFTPPALVSENESEDDLGSYYALKRPKYTVPRDRLLPQSMHHTSSTFGVPPYPHQWDSDSSSTSNQSSDNESENQDRPGREPAPEITSNGSSSDNDDLTDIYSDSATDDDESFSAFLTDLSETWMSIELDHQVSQAASDLY